MSRGSLVRLALVTAVAVAATLPSAANGKAEPVRAKFRATLTASVSLTSGYDHSRIEGGCTLSSSGSLWRGLSVRSGAPSTLVVDRGNVLRGTIRTLVGELQGSGGSSSRSSCSPAIALGDDPLARHRPVFLSDGQVAVWAPAGKGQSFSALGFVGGGGWNQVARTTGDALNLAQGIVSRRELLDPRRRVVSITGSYDHSAHSADGTSFSTSAVRWTLRLVRVR